MSAASSINQLLSWIDQRKGTYVDVVLAGKVFGGRFGESPQRIASASFSGTALRIEFSPTERLWVDDPAGIDFRSTGLFIRQASRVVFGWYYYGRPQTPDNWCERHYEFTDGRVSFFGKGPLKVPAGTASMEGEFAVALVTE